MDKRLILIVLVFLLIALIFIFIKVITNNDNKDGDNQPPPKSTTESCENIKVVLESDNIVVNDNNFLLANIPNKTNPVQLKAYKVVGGTKTFLSNDDVTYLVDHPVTWRINKEQASQIISVNFQGQARYLSEGYVFVVANYNKCNISSNKLFLATGDFYKNSQNDNVVAVWPKDFKPLNSSYSFNQLMTGYPNYLRNINKAYDVMAELYRGFRPFNGNTQVLALLDLPEHCGGNMNPLETAPCCYMECSNGEPQYNVVVHEVGHNFSYSLGMEQLTTANNSKIGAAGFGECVASLPVIYYAKDFYTSPEKYGFSKNNFEWQYYKKFLEGDIPYSQGTLQDFENMINNKQIKGVFDNNGKFDGVAVFCSFFQQYAYEYASSTNLYNHNMIRRFLRLFDDQKLYNFNDNKIETYFSAAFSAAAGLDLKDKLQNWGFTIDSDYYQQLYPYLLNKSNN